MQGLFFCCIVSVLMITLILNKTFDTLLQHRSHRGILLLEEKKLISSFLITSLWVELLKDSYLVNKISPFQSAIWSYEISLYAELKLSQGISKVIHVWYKYTSKHQHPCKCMTVTTVGYYCQYSEITLGWLADLKTTLLEDWIIRAASFEYSVLNCIHNPMFQAEIFKKLWACW